MHCCVVTAAESLEALRDPPLGEAAGFVVQQSVAAAFWMGLMSRHKLRSACRVLLGMLPSCSDETLPFRAAFASNMLPVSNKLHSTAGKLQGSSELCIPRATA